MEVGGGGEALADEMRADELAIALNELAVGLAVEERLREAGDDEGVEDAEEDGGDDGVEDGGEDVTTHGESL